MRQYLACKFRAADKRAYTYHWDGEPIEAGAEVKVPDRKGDGWMRATVHVLLGPEEIAGLGFETKSILGRAPAKDEPVETRIAGHREAHYPGEPKDRRAIHERLDSTPVMPRDGELGL